MVPTASQAVSQAAAREVRDGLLTWLLVACAGRPSHATGIRVRDLLDARVSRMLRLTCHLGYCTCASVFFSYGYAGVESIMRY